MKRLILLISVLVVTACTDKQSNSTASVSATKEQGVQRSFDFAQLTRGGQLFQKNCAACHGESAQGTANWQQADADGKFPPPPLNGSAHAWHHSKQVLVDTIKKGTIRIGGNMPPWEGKLSDAEIDDIIVWFQSKWSDEIYTVWYNTHVLHRQ